MRLLRDRGWLVAATAVLAFGSTRGDVVTFESATFVGYDNKAIIPASKAIFRDFIFQSNPLVLVHQVYLNWYISDKEQSRIFSWPESANDQPSSSSTTVKDRIDTRGRVLPRREPEWGYQPLITASPRRSLETRQSGQSGELDVAPALGRGTIKLKGEFFDPGASKPPLEVPLYFELVWQRVNGAERGASYSRFFTFYDGEVPSPYLLHHDLYLDDKNRFFNETLFPTDGLPTSGTAQPSPTSTSHDAFANSSGLGSEGDNSPVGQPTTSTTTSTTTAAGGGGGGGSGLARGAVIGIAVGVGVVALGAAFALAFFLIRRRQKRRDAAPSASLLPAAGAPRPGAAPADDLLAEKEAGNGVDVSPHSPYSDDGTGTGTGAPAHATPGPSGIAAPVPVLAPIPVPAAAAAAGAGAAAVAGAGAERSFTPYSDRRSARTGSVAATEAEAATPRALPTPYRHLVEEGMTAEEIRRLEEEERELDAAIEQAQRRS
ncbi:hypothetical protein VTJ83DRAFT_2027 [Remersonia thermophila]|uniref:Uncharacterized protein n=1 Tax=Remersonia thermophila TaxID=72144 RepID=A0ABR4DHL6_9PEZI